MAETANVMNSTLMVVYIDDVAIGHCKDAQLTVGMETRDITTKDSAGWRELLEGLRTWSITSSALYALDHAQSFSEVFGKVITRTPVTVKIASTNTGDKGYSGSAYLTSTNLSASDAEDNVAYDISLEGTGALTEAVIV